MFGASKSGSAALPSDPDFEYVTLLLDGNGTNGGQNNTFLDSSSNAFTITRNGNTTQGSFSPYGSLWSNYFPGSSSYLTVSANSAFQFSGDFTFECWYNLGNFSGEHSLFTINNGSTHYLNVDRTNSRYKFGINGSNYNFNTTFTDGAWVHVAIVRSGSTITCYQNGASLGTATNSATWGNNSQAFWISDLAFVGYISNLRLNSSALYTSSFTPSTTPLTAVSGTSFLTCQSNRFIDNSSNNLSLSVNGTTSIQRFSPFEPSAPYSTSVIGGSGYFDGSGDYLTLSNNAAFQFGSGDFTIDGWFYSTSSGDQVVISRWSSPDSNSAWEIIRYAGTTYFQVASGSSAITITTSSFPLNQWNHFAMSKGSTTMAAWLNGTRVGTATVSGSVNNGDQGPSIGVRSGGTSFPFAGYLANLRVVKGTDVYGVSNTTITVPTSPTTAITNTSLLTNFTNASIFDYAMMNDVETVGNAQVSTSVKKFGTGSLAFDGNGDYLLLPNSKPLTLYSNSPFTIEFWVYFNSVSAQQYILSNWTIGADGYAIATGVSTFANNQIAFFDGTSWRGGSTTVTTGTWYHFAVSSSGASSGTYIYLNGTSQVSAFTCAGTIDNAATQMFIGLAGSGATSFLNGYIDDLRITNGVNRYPSGTTFTPPSVAFPIY